MTPRGDDDPTVRLRPAPSPPTPPPPPPSRRLGMIGGGAALVVLALAAALHLLRPAPPPAEPAGVAIPAPAAPATPQLNPETATEAEILENRTPWLTLRRLAENPLVLVLDFPTLAEQARMLNRVAALIEKAGLPRDRVLDDAALEAAVRESGSTPETFYYGHNYRAADLARFFALAERDGVRLNEAEERLRGILAGMGWLGAGAAGAVVSIPHEGVEPWLDRRARAAMLRHELSHGEFFTVPAYAAQVWRFWREMLTEAERAAMRRVLAGASYDPAIEEVMANEAQAFLFHTPDARFFDPAMAGFPPDRVAALRAAFNAGLPPGWLKDAMSR